MCRLCKAFLQTCVSIFTECQLFVNDNSEALVTLNAPCWLCLDTCIGLVSSSKDIIGNFELTDEQTYIAELTTPLATCPQATTGQ